MGIMNGAKEGDKEGEMTFTRKDEDEIRRG